jgi:hypothetical protein
VDETPNLGLPYIMAAQSQKHVTHNEAIRALDAVVQLSVLDRNLTAPPGSPADGARYIVAASPTGAWSGHAGSIAAYQDGAWMFYAPSEGWIAWVADEDVAVVWSGSAWVALTTGEGGGGGEGDFSILGINATADTTNRLSVAADATLLDHDGDGHQLKINKASAGDTASLLYQDAYSGRAELGLAGDDDFHFKVSADGSTWKEAILIDRTSGAVSFPFTSLGGGGGRELLTANRTYYVRTDGSNANTGLANTSGGAFLTIQKAIDTAAGVDLGVYAVTIQVGDGTYTGANVLKPCIGAGSVTIQGNSGTPGNVIISTTSASAFFGNSAGLWTIKDMELRTTTSGACLYANGATWIKYQNIRFGTCAEQHKLSLIDATIECIGNYAIVGNAGYHDVFAVGGKIIKTGGLGTAVSVTLTGTPAFTIFALGDTLGTGHYVGFTFSGSATGQRYNISNNTVVSTNGGGASFLPGNATGAAATGAQYY